MRRHETTPRSSPTQEIWRDRQFSGARREAFRHFLEDLATLFSHGRCRKQPALTGIGLHFLQFIKHEPTRIDGPADMIARAVAVKRLRSAVSYSSSWQPQGVTERSTHQFLSKARHILCCSIDGFCAMERL